MKLSGPKNTQATSTSEKAAAKNTLVRPTATLSGVRNRGDFENTIFDGDGRIKISPIHAPAGTQPVPVRRATARAMIQQLLENGRSGFHSQAGMTLWVPVAYCVEKGMDFTLLGSSEEGFVVEIKG